MMVWPKLHLTEYERKYVDVYGDGKKPGVKRRAYRLSLTSKAFPQFNLPDVSTAQNLQISRRARVFAIMFAGNLDMWRLSVRNANGTQYVNPTPRTHKYPVVSSLVAGSTFNAAADGNIASPLNLGGNLGYTAAVGFDPGSTGQAPYVRSFQSAPWCIEPNWVLQPNETIVFDGEPMEPVFKLSPSGTATLGVVLDIIVYAWEFPSMQDK